MTNLNTTIQVKSKKMRVGRGIGSGKGKTSGRGVKGQKSRSGVAIKSFEGGQMPLYRRLPKRGFNPVNRINIAKINLNKIQILIEKKTLPSDKVISMELLKKNRVVGNKFSKIKLLGSGDLKSKIDFEVDYASKSAIKKLEKIGSKLILKKK